MRRYLVCLCAEDEPFCTEPGLAASLRDQPPDQIIEALLKRKDAVTAEALDSFEAQQVTAIDCRSTIAARFAA